MSNKRRIDATSLTQECIKKFTSGVYAEREKVAKAIVAAGFTPEQFSIGEDSWYDEDTMTMHYKCWPEPIRPCKPPAKKQG